MTHGLQMVHMRPPRSHQWDLKSVPPRSQNTHIGVEQISVSVCRQVVTAYSRTEPVTNRLAVTCLLCVNHWTRDRELHGRWSTTIIQRTVTSHKPGCLCKGKAIPVQSWTGSKGSRRLKHPDFQKIGTRSW